MSMFNCPKCDKFFTDGAEKDGVIDRLCPPCAEARIKELESDTQCARLRDQNKALREALGIALEAMQANIAYYTRKDEPALLRGIEAARKVLK